MHWLPASSNGLPNSPTTCWPTTVQTRARRGSRRRRSSSWASGRSTPSRETITCPRPCTCCAIFHHSEPSRNLLRLRIAPCVLTTQISRRIRALSPVHVETYTRPAHKALVLMLRARDPSSLLRRRDQRHSDPQILERFVVRRRGQQWISGSADSERRPVTHRQTSTFSLQFGVVSIDYSDLASLLVPASDTPSCGPNLEYEPEVPCDRTRRP